MYKIIYAILKTKIIICNVNDDKININTIKKLQSIFNKIINKFSNVFKDVDEY